jgi:uncharacterized protein (DUF1501 family)
MTTRRLFLKTTGLAMFGLGSAPAWLARAADSTPGTKKKTLVAIFQRGAVDGLNVVVPFGEKRYYELRPSIAIPSPKASQSMETAIDLDGFFGLHPSLSPLKAMYDARSLAIVHAAGSPDTSRSHFDAQDFMESGTPGRKATPDGWLNRALPPLSQGISPSPVSPIRAVSLGPELARTLRGKNAAVAINNLGDFQVRDAMGAGAFESMYASAQDKALTSAARDTFEAVKIVQSIQKQRYNPANGAKYPGGRLGQSMTQIAQLIKADVGLEVAFADVGGWDTHANEVGQTPAQGQLANLLRDYGQALAAFYQDMGDRMADVAVVTMSEFGRTARENGNRGTDHGHANVMMAFGGGVQGGKVYGDWPGLQSGQLFEDRDLAVTTDFRDVLGELVSKHLGNRDMKAVFPGYTPRFRGLLDA